MTCLVNSKMNLICIPYHDWRKIEVEGFRTRDAHFIEHLADNEDVDKILVVNRPITISEILIKRKKRKIKGEKIFSYGNSSLYKISSKLYILDFFSNDIFGPLLLRQKWFFKAFADKKLQIAFQKAASFLKMDKCNVLSQNIFSAKFIEKNSDKKCFFDAWDNFILFPSNKKMFKSFYNAYSIMSKECLAWFTNSTENISYYNKHYQPKRCYLIKNGVDVKVFSKSYSLPYDMEKIPRPIIGFGGKISHLVDPEIINFILQEYPTYSFVFVGQILSKEVFKKIKKTSNFYYLGDKSYSEYPAYVSNFDLGIVPYVSKRLQHGGDSMKVYEYLAAGLEVVGVPGGGMQDLSSLIYLANSQEEFSRGIKNAILKKGERMLPEIYTWEYKTKEIIQIIKE